MSSLENNPSHVSAVNPLTELNQNVVCCSKRVDRSKKNSTTPLSQFKSSDKENAAPFKSHKELSMGVDIGGGKGNDLEKQSNNNICSGFFLKDKALKPSSLQLCMQKDDPDSKRILQPVVVDSESCNFSGNIWDYSDTETAPASSWSTLPNRSLLFRPLPVDIGRCNCVIVKEAAPKGTKGGSLYSFYTHEGQGRQNRKLAVAHHRRRNGRWEFVIASNIKGIMSSKPDDSLIGFITSNFMGSKYQIWDQGSQVKSARKQPKLLAVVAFKTTIATWTGSYRSIKAFVPKHQSMQLKNASSQHIGGLPLDWEEKRNKVHQLFSRAPQYNKITRQYELDFRDKERSGFGVQRSVKNFQLTLEKNGRQTILQLGRVGKSMYLMDYRYPLTGFQAFSIGLAAIDSKPCCAI